MKRIDAFRSSQARLKGLVRPHSSSAQLAAAEFQALYSIVGAPVADISGNVHRRLGEIRGEWRKVLTLLRST